MADDSGNEALTEDTRPTAKIMERDVRAVCTCGYQSPPVPEWLALRAALMLRARRRARRCVAGSFVRPRA
jgi:hypothetical protein